jgi:cytochrome c-type biogenesis protein CcmH
MRAGRLPRAAGRVPATPVLLLAACVLITAALPAPGQSPAPGQHAASGAQPAALDKQVRAIASRLRCPVCQNESVADSPSELAGQMRALIRAKLEEGQPPEEIVAYFVSRYGQWILLDPPRKGVGWILWSAPVVALLVALMAAVAFLRRTVRRGEPAADGAESGAR